MENLNVPDKLAPTVQSVAKKLFKTESEQQDYYKFAMTILINNRSILNLDTTKVNACIFQMYMRGVKPDSQEAYIIPHRNRQTGEVIPGVQNGYKFALRKLVETGEFKDEPLVFDLHKSEFIEMDPHNRNVKYKKIPITSYEEFEKRQKDPIFGWVVQLKLTNLNIEKFYFDQEIMKHLETWSEAYKSFKKNGEKFGVFKTNMYEMKRKTAFMRVYTNYLPKTEAIMKAINDINALNNASFSEISENAVPEYFDNPNANNSKDNKNNKLPPKVYQDAQVNKPAPPKAPPKMPPKVEPIKLKNIENPVPEKIVIDLMSKLQLIPEDARKSLAQKIQEFIYKNNEKQGYITTNWKSMTWETLKRIHKHMEVTMIKFNVPKDLAEIKIDYPNEKQNENIPISNADPLEKIKSQMGNIKI